MRIAFHVNSFMTGGIERVLIQHLRSFDRSKVQLTLLITFHFPELEVLLKEVPSDVEVIHLLDKPIFNGTRQARALSKLPAWARPFDELMQWPRKIYAKKRFKEIAKRLDVIVDFDVTLTSLLKSFAGKKIGWFHFSVKNYHHGKAARLRKLGRQFATYDKIVMISDQMKNEALEMYPTIPEKFVRLYNGFDFASLRQKASDDSVLKTLPAQAKERGFILGSGRFDERQKDFTTMIRAFAKGASSISQDLVLVGDGPDRANLDELVATLGIQDRVHFLGFQSNPLPFVKACDFFAQSSKFEGLPTVLIEALIFHKTIAAADCPTGPREILNEGQCGYLFPVGDSDALAKILNGLSHGNLPKVTVEKIEAHLKSFDIKEIHQEFFKMLATLGVR